MLHSQIEKNKKDIEKFAYELKINFAAQQSRLEQFKVESESAMKCTVELVNKITSSASVNEENNEDKNENDSRKELPQSNHDVNRDPGFHSENLEPRERNASHRFNNPTIQQYQEQSVSRQNDISTQLYELHISPFETTVECDNIVQHIVNNTSVKDNKLFSVQRLGGYIKTKSFISFKISTLSSDNNNVIIMTIKVYQKIVNMAMNQTINNSNK